MIVVKVELHSAITGNVTELARMTVATDGTGDVKTGNYNVYRARKGQKTNVDLLSKPFRAGRVECHARLNEHVWNLVRKAIEAVT